MIPSYETLNKDDSGMVISKKLSRQVVQPLPEEKPIKLFRHGVTVTRRTHQKVMNFLALQVVSGAYLSLANNTT
jgi:hypothetical protein